MSPHGGSAGASSPHDHGPSVGTGEPLPRLIAWEVTRRCMLSCKHCRASATSAACGDELTTSECFKLLDNIATLAKPILILTGGEPMLRDDIYDIARHARGLELPVVMAPCGLLLSDETVRQIADAGIHCISLSLDGADAATHDEFRGMPGAFDAVMAGIAAAKRGGLDFQINTTITRHSRHQVGELLDLSIRLGASVFNPFLLVPTGRGKQLVDQELSAQEYEETLKWLADQHGRTDIQTRVTCAPHYQRIIRQCGKTPNARNARGCMGGTGFAFISHTGIVQICGFMEVPCGDVRAEGLDFARVWRMSEVLRQVRDVDHYHGRCGRCEFRKVCGGCRARAFAISGDYLAEEPYCSYQPLPSPGPTGRPLPSRERGERVPCSHALSAGEHIAAPAELDATDRKLLTMIQADFPVVARPFDEIAVPLGTTGEDVLARVKSLMERRLIRRLGAVFDARKLGYISTLVAAVVPQERIDEVAAQVSEIPGVTHNYRREHRYNLWFTLTCRSAAELESTLAGLRCRTGVEAMHSLPALAMYKARVQLDVFIPEGAVCSPAVRRSSSPEGAKDIHGEGVLTDNQKCLVRLLQGSLPLVGEPYTELARRMGAGRSPEDRLWDEAGVMRQARVWLGQETIKRIGAVVFHRELGFIANGMVVLAVDPARVDAVGRLLAARPEVSHCYRRPRMPDWPYDLFTMIHGRSESQVRELVAKLAADAGISQFNILFSTKEYKKVSMEFFVEP